MISFRAWLDEQTPARQIEIKTAMRRWLRGRNAGVTEDPSQSDYLESFRGYSDSPAGKGPRREGA